MMKRNKLLMFSLCFAATACIWTGSMMHNPAATFADEATQEVFANDTTQKILEVNGDYTTEATTLTIYEGMTSGANSVNKDAEEVTVEGAEDGKALRFNFTSWGATTTKKIVFAKPVQAMNIEELQIRLYAYLSTGTTYDVSKGGIRLFGLDVNGGTIDTGYMIPADVTQNEWTVLTLSASDAAKLANADGYIYGFQIAQSADNGNNTAIFHSGTSANTAVCAYMLIDTISYEFGEPKTYRVSFAEENIMEMEANWENGYILSEPETPVKEGYEFVGWVDQDGNDFDFSHMILRDVVLTARWIPVDCIFSAFGEYSIENTTLGVDFANITGANATNVAPNLIQTEAFNKALKYCFTSWGHVTTRKIVFEEPVAASSFDGIVIRMYVHFSAGVTYKISDAGVRLFSYDATGAKDTGYVIPANVTQDQWISLYLTKEETANLIDADGYFRGFQIGQSVDNGNDEANFYGGTLSKGNSWLLIESIQLSKQCELTFKTDETTRTVTAQTGIACPEVISVPSKEGYVFAGWWNGEKQFDPSATVYGSAEYLAKFVRLTTETVDGLYKSNDRMISLIVNGESDFTAVSEDVVSYGVGEDMVLYLLDSKGYVTLVDLGTYDYVAYCTITYVTGDGEISVRTEKGSVATEKVYEREGYNFVGWYLADVKFDFAIPIEEDITLVAKWTYDEVDDYAMYYGSYYNAEEKTLLVLKEGNAVTIEQEDQETDGKYYVLTSGSVVIEWNGGVYEDAIYSVRLLFNGKDYTKLLSYIFNFDTQGGTEIDSVKVSSGNYRVEKPADPTREGYTFQGWFTSDGKEFDFNTVIEKSTTVYAQWLADVSDSSENESQSNDEVQLNCFGGISALASVGAVAFMAATIVLKKKED